MPKFKSKTTGTLYVNTSALFEVEKGTTFTVDDPIVVKALRDNPDVEEFKSDSKKKK